MSRTAWRGRCWATYNFNVTVKGVPFPQILKASLELWPTGIDPRPLLLEDLVAAFELFKLQRQVLAETTHPHIPLRRPEKPI
jgi:hypothetical protein